MALLLVALPLAACIDPASPDGPPTFTETVTEGTYLLPHPGGRLDVVATGNWSLFDPTDALFSHGNGSRPFQGELPGGAWVLWIHEGEAELTWPAGDRRHPFLPRLPTHVERHVVVWRDASLVPHIPFLLPDPLPATSSEVVLRRPAQAMSIRAAGSYEDLQVEVTGPEGTLHAEGSAYIMLPPSVRLVPAEGWAGTSRTFEVHVSARHLGGPVLLEAWSYSRAAPSDPPVQGAPQGFLYGEVTGTPVRFDVHPEADDLTFSADEDVTVAVWDGEGRRVATFDVPGGGAVSIPVAGGAHVAVAWGRAALWAPVAPADLDLHPLEVRTFGQSVHAGNGTYTTREYVASADGVLYDVVAWSGGQSLDCWPGMARILQGERGSEEVVGYAADAAAARVGPFLGRMPGPVTVAVEGPGNCFEVTFEALFFVL